MQQQLSGRLSVRAVVTDVTMYVDYIRDSRIINAYKHVMEDISGLSEHWIVGALVEVSNDVSWTHRPCMSPAKALQMFPGAAGNITVDYILTVPFVEGAGGELVPIVPVEQAGPKFFLSAGVYNPNLKSRCRASLMRSLQRLSTQC